LTVLLDTHIWIWWVTAGGTLSKRERQALGDAASEGALSISAISLWEVQMLHQKGRLVLPISLADWLTRATDENVLTVLPLDRDVIIALDALPPAFHGDPADRIIVATARAHALPLATHDSAIRRARVVKLWKS
jgi:PIN domain nuclease of toxin-antitoxin system